MLNKTENSLREHEEEQQEEEKKKYPKAVFFIIGNEFCERFSYYGMRAVLTLYLTDILLYGDDAATMIYHAFSMACYFTPLFGAMIADSFLGKFRTIFYISIIYVIGNITISSGAIPQSLYIMNAISVVGLTLIAIGTGGIKPCVAAFGGDQFEPGQEQYLQKFFSFFYLSINLGSVLSTFITPLLREDVKCFGNTTCFPLAFGVPAALMILSLILFLLGRPLYKYVKPTGNIVIKVFKCICHAIGRRTKEKKSANKRTHWLDFADDKYDNKMLKDIKDVLHVLFLYLPLPVFWALFDQQGSRWTLQATKMDGNLFGYTIKPDQMQVLNPFLIIAFIPLFEYVVYPVLKTCHLLQKPLQRMTLGGILAALSFVVTGFLQLHLENSLPAPPTPGLSKLILINGAPCDITLSGSYNVPLHINEVKVIEDVKTGEQHNMTISTGNCTNQISPYQTSINLLDEKPVQVMFLTALGDQIRVYMPLEEKLKSEKGEAHMRIFFNINFRFVTNDTVYFLVQGEKTYRFYPTEFEDNVGFTKYHALEPGIYEVFLPLNETEHQISVGKVEVKNGGNYVLNIIQNLDNTKEVSTSFYTLKEPNTVSMFLQIPQYIIMTAGEIMFSITGLEFSYSQAPTSMKSVLQAAWLLTVAFGNLIVVIVAETRLFERQSYEFFMFAGLMGVDMLIFSVMAYFYKYVNKEESAEVVINDKKGVSNESYVEDTNL